MSSSSDVERTRGYANQQCLEADPAEVGRKGLRKADWKTEGPRVGRQSFLPPEVGGHWPGPKTGRCDATCWSREAKNGYIVSKLFSLFKILLIKRCKDPRGNLFAISELGCGRV
jgi:hypothetical protein